MLSLSIVITTYQCTRRSPGPAIFQRTLNSLDVAIQTFRRAYPQVKLDGVIVDDHSTDETVAIAQTWLSTLEVLSPWRLVVQPNNLGLSASRNRGAKETKGDILCFCDDDDIYAPQHFQLIYGGFHKSLPLEAPFLPEAPGDRPAMVTMGIQFSDPIHSDWKQGLEATLIQNRGIRRSLHEFIGGFPTDDCFRSGGEDLAYVRWAETFGRRHHIPVKTLEYCRYPGSHFDRQIEKFIKPFNLDKLSDELQKSPEALVLNQARSEAYGRGDRQLRVKFQKQWLDQLKTPKKTISDSLKSINLT